MGNIKIHSKSHEKPSDFATWPSWYLAELALGPVGISWLTSFFEIDSRPSYAELA
jgi:hypothetical protein